MPEPEPDPLELQPSLPLCLEPDELPRRKPWAWLLKHVFEQNVSICPRCQGPTTWLELATESDAIDRALVKHGLAPPRARPPPLPPLCPDAQLSLPLWRLPRRLDLGVMHRYASTTMHAGREHVRGKQDTFWAASTPFRRFQRVGEAAAPSRRPARFSGSNFLASWRGSLFLRPQQPLAARNQREHQPPAAPVLVFEAPRDLFVPHQASG